MQRGFFNGLPISRGAERLPKALVESGAVISSGQPADLGGNITGFVDPRTGTYRTLPVEILPAGKPTGPLYHPESMGTQLALPFRVKGSIGMVHSLDDADDASSEMSQVSAMFEEKVTLFDVQPALGTFLTSDQSASS